MVQNLELILLFPISKLGIGFSKHALSGSGDNMGHGFCGFWVTVAEQFVNLFIWLKGFHLLPAKKNNNCYGVFGTQLWWALGLELELQTHP